MNPFRPTFQHFDNPFTDFGLSTTGLSTTGLSTSIHDGMRHLPSVFDRNVEMGRPDLGQQWGQAREERMRQFVADVQPLVQPPCQQQGQAQQQAQGLLLGLPQGQSQGQPKGQSQGQSRGQQREEKQVEEQQQQSDRQAEEQQPEEEEDEESERLMTEAEVRVACTCKRYCLDKFDPDTIQAHIYSLKEMAKDEKEMFIMGVLQRYGEEPRGHQQRKRIRFRYVHDDKPVCKTVFCYINDIGNKALRGLKEHLCRAGPVARVHGNKGRKPHHALDYDQVKFCVDFLISYSEIHKLPIPEFQNGQNESSSILEETPIILPSNLSKAMFHKLYLEACNDTHMKPLGLASFKSVWKTCVPHIKILGPKEDISEAVSRLTASLSPDQGQQGAQFRSQNSEYQAHNSEFRVQATYFQAQEIDFGAQETDFRSQEIDLQAQKSDSRKKKAGKRAKKADLRAQKAEYRAQKIRLPGTELQHTDMGEMSDCDVEMSEAEIKVACTCKRYCLEKFDPDAIQAHINSMREMSKDEKEMFIMGIMQRFGEEPRGNKKRQRTRFRYIHDDKAVCKTVFCYINDIGNKALRGVKEHLCRKGPVARIHGNKGRKSHHALQTREVKFVVDYLISFAELHKLTMPDAPNGLDEESPILLPSSLTKVDVHKQYLEACQDANVRTLGITSFKSVWQNCVPHIKIKERPWKPKRIRNRVPRHKPAPNPQPNMANNFLPL